MEIGPEHGPKRVLVFGASGTIGQACVAELVKRGCQVTCFLRPQSDAVAGPIQGTDIRRGDITSAASIMQDAFQGETFDVVISCLASRSGEPEDAQRIDYQAHADILAAAKSNDARHMILLSAICVQKPKLAFQRAKLAFEEELIRSGMTYSIVRPTAFFKSLSGQIARVHDGKPFLVFGDGLLTSCKPISDADLAVYMADCIDDTARHGAVLPIGGPGPAITPMDQAAMLFAAADKPARIRRVPVALMDGIIAVLSALGKVSARARAKAEYARIGRYYATESMLVLDPATNSYDPAKTPETGTDLLQDHYRSVIAKLENSPLAH